MSQGGSGKLADTTFNTSPDNKLAVVDVYENGSSDVENSFQEEYHKAPDSASDSFKDIGKKAKDGGKDGPGGSNPFDALKDITKGAGDFNKVLNGIKSGDLSSLTSLTGGAGGIKQLSDMVSQATQAAKGLNTMVSQASKTANSLIGQANTAVKAITSTGNSLKGGLNNNFLDRLTSSMPLAQQIKAAVRSIGTIKSSFSSLEKSMGKASTVLGGDSSSINTSIHGVRNKAKDIEKAKPYDSPVSKAQTQALVNKLKNINPQISSAINDLPVETQAALVRGFNDETVSKGLITGNKHGVTSINSEVSSKVLKPINSIISSFSPTTKTPDVIQDTGAISVLLSGVTNIANKAGIKNTFSTVTKNITNKEVVAAAAKPLVIRAIDEGDLDTLIDLSKSQACGELKNFAPALISKTCYNVKRPSGMGQQEFAGYYKEIKTAFDKISPKWTGYFTSQGVWLINGACINSNPFICDLIESSLNIQKNVKFDGKNSQVSTSKDKPGSQLSPTNAPGFDNSFSQSVQSTVSHLNKEAFIKLKEENISVIVMPAKEAEPTVPAEPAEKVLDFSHEKFLLLASVFVDNSVQSEIEKHFPYLYQRLSGMGTFSR